MSWYPAPELRGEIQFVFLKSLSYGLRMMIIILLMILGVVIQLALNFYAGLPLLLAGTLISIIRGYHAKPNLTGKETWSRVTPDEFKKIKSKQMQLKSWDRDAFDITNRFGCIILSLLIFLFAALSRVINTWIDEKLGTYVLINGLVVLLPHWVTGVRTYLKQDQLILKIRLLETIIKQLTSDSEVQVHPMLSVQKTKEDRQVPRDARLMISLVNAPEDFLGIQVQISVNTVQGSDYPYLYCVLLAREKAHLLDRDIKIAHAPRITVEKSISDDVQVLVVRQTTTKTSGYHTNSTVSWRLVSYAIEMAREFLN